ncbi:MAG TPA: CehA/McbA family metallohydrolase, partial [Tepidisphaeraceae bacterium]|nr:CehA/McbA family metallohydrolase [Tepidisphaeraceae bacterium]
MARHSRAWHLGLVLLFTCARTPVARADVPVVEQVALQPLAAHARALAETLEFTGAHLPDEARKAIESAAGAKDELAGVRAIQAALDPLCLAVVDINPEARVKVAAGPAAPRLLEAGWRTFLIKVHNQAGLTGDLKVESPQGKPLANSPADQVRDRWLEIAQYTAKPLADKLSGLEVEYRVVQFYSRDAGRRQATLVFLAGQGNQDLGFRSELAVMFTADPAREVAFRVKDEHGKPTTAALVIRDKAGHVYPSQAKRLAPDFFFQQQVYRADGETVKLPDGAYTLEVTRGPEYLPQSRPLVVAGGMPAVEIALKRWIDPAKRGYWSGDHHIHAAGCAHYNQPTEGVLAGDMMRHILGEDLKVGCNLTWGPCFDFQKQFFTGADDKVSTHPYLLRYDIEVSGFGSHRSGHLCLLRLKEQIYPGGDSKNHWPTLGLNTLKWAKRQGAVTGPAHSGNGIAVKDGKLPSYEVPDYNGIGANEFIVDVTHEVPGPDGKPVPAVDFISTVDTEPKSELNMWYHVLNCGFRVRASGETDFPCIYGERVGMGRSYVRLA